MIPMTNLNAIKHLPDGHTAVFEHRLDDGDEGEPVSITRLETDRYYAQAGCWDCIGTAPEVVQSVEAMLAEHGSSLKYTHVTDDDGEVVATRN